jgi:hypothetical protein
VDEDVEEDEEEDVELKESVCGILLSNLSPLK